ncbi:MAG TPA: hypothetical protein VE974_10865 [Thermoanaerobaculia bacterium]|nr:hypothetical protein [Thermoanaerobaculia bacterium]
MRKSFYVGSLAAFFMACASVTVTPLAPDGTALTGKAEGVRYYLPKPYLLVTELPSETASSTPATNAPKSSNQVPAPQNPAVPSPFTPPPGGDGGEKKEDASAAGAPSTNTSFAASNSRYVLKLIYLPDLEHPMSIRIRAGLGTAQMKPTLQDGWMLTGLDASADAKTAEILTSIAGIIGAIKGGGGDAGGGAPGGGPGQERDCELCYSPTVLRPGLYKFVYDDKGMLTDLVPVRLFDSKTMK